MIAAEHRLEALRLGPFQSSWARCRPMSRSGRGSLPATETRRQKNRPVEHNSRRARGNAPGGHPGTNPASNPDRQISQGQDRLEQDERRISPNKAACFLPHGDQTVCSGRDGGLGMISGDDLAEHPRSAFVKSLADAGKVLPRTCRGANDRDQAPIRRIEPGRVKPVRIKPQSVRSDPETLQISDRLNIESAARRIEDP